ncbi:hypothetical protein IFM89_037722 [Coptis chinensis]|uniref:MATH domain-containing protein n=1 Tax=Coptis chinensis TaxID=261450 RepID=A0A835IIE9_9MAGN|nr:hypothetical protein IFM89_037722 [Coptis chinensis]
MSMFCKLNLTLHAETQHQFSAKHPDWGFWNFIPLSEPRDPDRGFLLDDTLIEEDVFPFRPLNGLVVTLSVDF